MAQYAQDEGSRSQSTPFGCKSSHSRLQRTKRLDGALTGAVTRDRNDERFTYAFLSDDAAFLAQQQQQQQMHYGFPDNFPFNHQHIDGGTSGTSILNQNDNSLLNNFFGNPDITNQMDFNFDPSADPGAEESGANAAEGLFDLDNPSTTVHDPTTIFAAQNFNFDEDRQAQSQSNGNSQRHSMSMQMTGGSDGQKQTSEAPEEEAEEKAAVEGLMGMSNNRPTPAQMMFGSTNGFGVGSAWGGINFNSPLLHLPNMQGRMLSGRQPAHNQQMGEQHEQAHEGSFGYGVSPVSQLQGAQGFSSNTSMHMQPQAFAGQQRGRHHSMADIRTDGFTHIPHDGPTSAQLPDANNSTFYSHFNSHIRPTLSIPRYGSDENFGSSGYRPPNNYTGPDEKASNLNHVPLADEASAHARSTRQSGMLPPGHGARAPSRQSQGYNSSSSQPTTPIFFNNMANQQHLAGLPSTTGSMNMSFGGFGMAPFTGHGHPHAHGGAQQQYYRTMHPNATAGATRQARANEEAGQENSASDDSESESDSPAAPIQPSRKRRKSDYVRDGEDDYRPASGKHRAQNSALDGSSDEDEYRRTDTGTGKKRARASAVHRNSTTSHADTPSARTPRPTSASGGRRNSRSKRPSTTTSNNVSRLPLTDEQRRQNHIMSEKNRRDLIKTNYTELNDVIPALKNGKSGLSKAEVLTEIVDFIEELEAGNENMKHVIGNYVAPIPAPSRSRKQPNKQRRQDGSSSDEDGSVMAGSRRLEAY